MGDLSNPISSDLPLDLQEEMLSLARRRQIANALRARNIQDPEQQAVNGMVLPSGFSTLGRNLDAISGQIDLDNIDQRSKGAVSKYQDGLKSATSRLLGMMDPFSQVSPQEMGDNASNALLSGVPKEMINGAVQQRMMVSNTNAMLGADSPFAPPSAMGFVPPGGAQGAPGAASVGAGGGPVGGGAPAGGGSMGFMPGSNSAAPGTGPNRPATPLANLSQKKLFVLGTFPGPMQALAKEELAARQIKVERGTGVDGMGNVLFKMMDNGQMVDFTKVDADGKPAVSDPLQELSAKRKGAEKRAEVAETPIEIEYGENQKRKALGAELQGGGSMGFMPGQQPSTQIRLDNPTPRDIAQLQATFGGGGQAQAPQNGTLPASAIAARTAEREGLAKNAVEMAKEGDGEAKAAQGVLGSNAQLRNMLNQFTPGKLTPIRSEVAAVFAAAGFPDDMVKGMAGGNLEAIQAAHKMVVDNAFAGVKADMAGAGRITQAEILLKASNSPNITIRRAASEAMLNISDAIQNYKLGKQQARAQWTGEGKPLDQFEAAWNGSHRLADSLPTEAQTKATLAQGDNAGHATVANDADYNALPSGATFIGPDGKTRRKP